MKNKNIYKLNVVRLFVFMQLILFSFLLGCAAKQTPVPEVVADKPAYFKEISKAAQSMSKSLSRQLMSKTNSAISPIVVDVFFNEQSAEVSAVGKMLQENMIMFLKQETPPFSALPLGGASLQNSKWIVLGSFMLEPQKDDSKERWVKVISEVRDIASDLELARSVSFVDARLFSSSEPVRFYKDAPMFMTSSRNQKGAKAAQQSLSQRLSVDARIADARNLYDAGDYKTAEAIFLDIATATGFSNIIALSGLYQCQFRSMRLAEAEASFGRLVNAGLDSGNLSVKFLFKVNSTDFLANNELASQYPIWIRQIAQQLSSHSQCLIVNGHASKSGSAELNERLSRQRAERIAQLLRRARPALNGRIKSIGKGFKENIVGSGTNDALDAIDRRVDFELSSCK